MEIIWWKI